MPFRNIPDNCWGGFDAVVIFYYDYMGATTHNQQFYHNSFINIAGQFSPSIVLMATGIILLFKNMASRSQSIDQYNCGNHVWRLSDSR